MANGIFSTPFHLAETDTVSPRQPTRSLKNINRTDGTIFCLTTLCKVMGIGLLAYVIFYFEDQPYFWGCIVFASIFIIAMFLVFLASLVKCLDSCQSKSETVELKELWIRSKSIEHIRMTPECRELDSPRSSSREEFEQPSNKTGKQRGIETAPKLEALCGDDEKVGKIDDGAKRKLLFPTFGKHGTTQETFV